MGNGNTAIKDRWYKWVHLSPTLTLPAGVTTGADLARVGEFVPLFNVRAVLDKLTGMLGQFANGALVPVPLFNFG